MKAMTIVYGAIGLLIAIYVLQAVLPLLFGLSFTNASIWGTFGASILPTVFPLILAAGVLFIVFMYVQGMIKHRGGKGTGGL